MSSQSHRVFVGNLPHEATKDELLRKFKKFGTVESVEIRTKKDPSTGDPLATFSFVNINADRESLDQCARQLNGVNIGGNHIKVELAKESFLQRLQRERQAGVKTAPPTQPKTAQPSVPKKGTEDHVKKPTNQKRIFSKKSVSSSSESSDSEDENITFHQTSKLPMFKGIKSLVSIENESKPHLEREALNSSSSNLVESNKFSGVSKRPTKAQFQSENSDILKKFESFSDVWKDDEPSYENDSYGSRSRQGVRNQSFNKFPSKTPVSKETNYMQSTNQAHLPSGSYAGDLSGSIKSIKSGEEKRLKSLDEKRQAFEQQKEAVKLALSDKSAPRTNKKVVFGDDDEPLSSASLNGQKHSLFNESDDEAAAEDWKTQFEVKKQFQGEKGKQLLKLQSNFNNDRRFHLDERFFDGDEETNSKSLDKPQSKSDPSEEGVDGIEGLAEEREQQLQILSSVLGQPIPTAQPSAHHKSKIQGMLRFDPSKPNHAKYEISKESKVKKRKKKGDEWEDDETEEGSDKRKFRREEKEPEPVSQNKFYDVSDTLADALRQSKEGQSSGFSLLQMFGSPSVPSESREDKKAHGVELMRKDLKKRPNLDDSSSDEEGPTADYNAADQEKAFSAANPGIIKSSHGVWQESFFLQSGDTRLNEGSDFFKVEKDEADAYKQIAEKRSKLFHRVALGNKRHVTWRKNDMPKSHRMTASNSKGRNFKPKVKKR